MIMLILSESEDKLGFSWEDLESMNYDEWKAAVFTIVRRMDGYANTGLIFILD